MMIMNLRFLPVALIIQTCLAFQSPHTPRQFTFHRQPVLFAGANDESSGGEEYRNAVTGFLSNFMQNAEQMNKENPLSKIDFDAPKIGKVGLKTLAAMLDAELYEKEWFVTGNVNPSYFAEEFEFQDPDVRLKGIEEYARAVNKLFDQETSRAEIISVTVNDALANTITVTWRLSGKVNVGPGLKIKPYICYTDFTVNNDGLITFQEDRFDIPGWDIVLSSIFPFLIGKVTAPIAPPVVPRKVPAMPTKSILDKAFEFFR